jgi:hypothetical protein
VGIRPGNPAKTPIKDLCTKLIKVLLINGFVSQCPAYVELKGETGAWKPPFPMEIPAEMLEEGPYLDSSERTYKEPGFEPPPHRMAHRRRSPEFFPGKGRRKPEIRTNFTPRLTNRFPRRCREFANRSTASTQDAVIKGRKDLLRRSGGVLLFEVQKGEKGGRRGGLPTLTPDRGTYMMAEARAKNTNEPWIHPTPRGLRKERDLRKEASPRA